MFQQERCICKLCELRTMRRRPEYLIREVEGGLWWVLVGGGGSVWVGNLEVAACQVTFVLFIEFGILVTFHYRSGLFHPTEDIGRSGDFEKSERPEIVYGTI